ncbi:ABC transporter ATP-binding protein [Megalodesulfovibrio gigas]|uniref:Putative ABC transporter n=1 Tax=Megalodesulfovibrio gigas (strain ATCC 19364 / DSM 1382 / NCIMB 9332 / VKM B-1759) TaxID=1121448 RepID=T2GFL9_MEGG1|nr:ATP-binding cassette domain-containing protein [Megalodesulfovibrio gigas]AGW14989.1 putative ABC transporter [Megalodesulfovibrio gigas DSM 1382 = ATCC 19364]
MLVLEKVVKYFNKGTINEVLAINRLDLIVERADFITIIGSNGAGKSTMLSCMAGTIIPDAGRLVLSDQDVTTWPEWKRARFIGRVFQDPLKGTSASLSIEENLALAMRRGKRRGFAAGVTRDDRDLFRERLRELGLGLEDRLKDQVGLLSGGQRQALTLLMATMVRPEVLLLDEHTAALDPKTAQQILELTQKIVDAQKLTTLMVTHNMRQAIALGNRLVMLHQGEVILDLEGEAKRALTVDDLLQQFYAIRGETLASDRLLLG